VIHPERADAFFCNFGQIAALTGHDHARPRYRLVLDPMAGHYLFEGRPLALDGKLKTAGMLEELARHPGETVTRDQLCRVMWPESYGGRGTLEMDWDRRIRGHKKVLAQALVSAAPVGSKPIEAVSSGDDAVGGYRLAIEPQTVVGWSR